MRWAGLALTAAVFVAIAQCGYALATDVPHVWDALAGGLIAALATAAGTMPVLLSRQFSRRVHDGLLGFGAGVMLAASAFSLVIPALTAAKSQGATAWGAGALVGAGILFGASLLFMIDRAAPHEGLADRSDSAQARAIRRVWLFVLAIVLHNIPEGLAIGVAFAGTDAVRASALTTGIGIQDVPEGMVVALALRGVGFGRLFAVFVGSASGLVEPLAAVLGASLISLSAGLLPWGLAAAAGAMLFVISHEIIPESHRRGHAAVATGGLMLGFVLMMCLDTAMG